MQIQGRNSGNGKSIGMSAEDVRRTCEGVAKIFDMGLADPAPKMSIGWSKEPVLVVYLEKAEGLIKKTIK